MSLFKKDMKAVRLLFCFGIVLLLSSNAHSTPSASISGEYNCSTGEYDFVLDPGLNSYDEIIWDFDDGTTFNSGTMLNVGYSYSLTDTYTVTATFYLNSIQGVTAYMNPQDINVTVVNNLAPDFTANDLGGGTFEFIYTGPSFISGGGYFYSYTFDYGDGNEETVQQNASLNTGDVFGPHTYYGVTSGSVTPTLSISVRYSDWSPLTCGKKKVITVPFIEDPCCSNFAPIVGERYWVSAWVKEDHANQVKTYTNTSIEIEFLGGTATVVAFTPTGDIIEGWQRIVGDFTVPSGTSDLQVHMVNESSSIAAYFDDVRIHPFNASMKSYVYDPETLWLTAELDDNNYATFYEYDKEGQLIRIKKETARGIMTIQESRSSNPKKENE